MRITFARGAMLAAALLVPALWAAPVEAETLGVEKPHLKLGFIKLTDLAPLAIAYEKGFFEDEGLFVTLEPQDQATETAGKRIKDDYPTL